jgi:hypothetical protein
VNGVAKGIDTAPIIELEQSIAAAPECSYAACTRDPIWWYEHHCGRILYVCEPHRQDNDGAIEQRMSRSPDKRPRCLACHERVPHPIPWRPL